MILSRSKGANRMQSCSRTLRPRTTIDCSFSCRSEGRRANKFQRRPTGRMQRSRWAALNQIKEALLDIFGRGVFMVHYEDKSSSDDRPNCRSYDALPPAPDAILPVWSPPPAWCLKFAESSCLSLDRVGALHLNSQELIV